MTTTRYFADELLKLAFTLSPFRRQKMKAPSTIQQPGVPKISLGGPPKTKGGSDVPMNQTLALKPEVTNAKSLAMGGVKNTPSAAGGGGGAFSKLPKNVPSALRGGTVVA